MILIITPLNYKSEVLCHACFVLLAKLFSCYNLLFAFWNRPQRFKREHACLINLSIAELLKDNLGT